MSSGGRVLEVEQEELVELLGALAPQGVAAWIRARGVSMQPTIPHDSEILVEPVAPEACVPGDVVAVVAAHGLLVVHRIIRADADQLWLQGDHCVKRDAPIPRRNVLGRVTAVRVRGGVRPLQRARPRSVRQVVARWYSHARRQLGHG